MLGTFLPFVVSAVLLSCRVIADAPYPQSSPDYVLVGTAANHTINCQQRYSVIFNGTSPGPPLYMKENYTTWVRVYNHIQDQNLTVVSLSGGGIVDAQYQQPGKLMASCSTGMD